MLKIILVCLLMFASLPAVAGVYDGVDMWAVTSDTTTRTVSGGFAVAASTKTHRTFTTRIDGTNGYTSTKQITASSVTALGGFLGPLTGAASLNVLKTGDTMTGPLTTSSSMTAAGGFVGALIGNAATATKLATARTINGVSFDGTANINIATTSYLADGVSLALTGATFSAKSSSVTLQGNTFNGASQLVKLDALSKLPAVDASQLLNLPSTSGGAVLASTQTFTGQNTFANSVTISSFTATSATLGANSNVVHISSMSVYMDFANITIAGAGNCTVNFQSNSWLTSCTGNSTGAATLNFSVAYKSLQYSCSGMAKTHGDASTEAIKFVAKTTTYMTVHFNRNLTSPGIIDNGTFDIVCIGAR